MADTIRKDFPGIPCEDCGDKNNTEVWHNGPLVPSGASGHFCENCFQLRAEDYGNHLPPRQLGEKSKELVL